MAATDDEAGRGRPTKVARLIERHELEPLGAEMEAAWTADGDERRSLRELATEFNRELLAARMREAGQQPLDREPANVYRLLTDDGVSGADRTRARRQLARLGVDVDDLVEEFVSYQAIRTYLRSHRNAEYSPAERDSRAVAAENVRRLRGRTAAVTEQRVRQLRDGGELDIGEFRTIVDVSVVCERCGRQYGASELIDRGACACGDES